MTSILTVGGGNAAMWAKCLLLHFETISDTITMSIKTIIPENTKAAGYKVDHASYFTSTF